MKKQAVIKLSANFRSNLEKIEHYLSEAEIPHIFDDLLTELTETAIPNLQLFPEMGRLFTQRSVRSVEVSNGLAMLRKKLKKSGMKEEIREYLLADYLILYACSDSRAKITIYLLSIKHHRQLSFNFESLWQSVP